MSSKMFGLFVALVLIAPATYASQTPAETGWEEISHDDGIMVWRKEIEGSPVVAFKGEGVINAPIAKVANILFDTPRKLEWVARAVEAKDLRQVSPTERIEYNHTGSPMHLLLNDRDFVFLGKVEGDKAKKQLVLTMKSINDPSMPEKDGVVRGELFNSSYVLTSIDDGKKTNFLVEIHADPKGGVPKWIVNLFQKSWPRKTIEGVQKQAAKGDVIENQMVRDYFEGKLPQLTQLMPVTVPAVAPGANTAGK